MDTSMTIKQSLKAAGISVDTFESSVDWKDFKLNSDGLIPVIVQDYKTNEVLMLAYMNEEAFNNTLATGRMTYFSRSRQAQWVKGETSGHFQYVKSLKIDCDNDTLLATVKTDRGSLPHWKPFLLLHHAGRKRNIKENQSIKRYLKMFSM